MAIPLFPANICLTESTRVRPLASVFVELDPGSGEFFPVGCCLTSISPPKVERDSTVDDTCINFDGGCFSNSPDEVACPTIPNTQPGNINEAELGFTTNHVPGGQLNQWFEEMILCGHKLRWIVCYANGYRQLISCAWVKSHAPQDLESGGQSLQADVMISVCGNWGWATANDLSEESPPAIVDGVDVPDPEEP